MPGSIDGEPNAPSELQADLNRLYGSKATWLPLLQRTLAEWSQVCGAEFLYEPHDDGVAGIYNTGLLGIRGDVRLSDHPLPGGILADTYFPDTGELYFNSADFAPGGYLTDLSNDSLKLRNTLAHELGHALGLAHTTVAKSLMNAFIATSFDGPQADDIAGARAEYGDTPKAGDANRDGRIDISDYGRIDFGIACGLTGWGNGDFNYDGKIDVSDYGVIDFAIASQGG